MNWKQIGANLAQKGLPILGGALGGPAGALAGSLIASVFGSETTPEAVEKVISSDPNALIKLKELESKNTEILLKFYTDISKMDSDSEVKNLETVNNTILQEYKTEDRFKTYWRPLFGYSMAFGFLSSIASLSYSLAYAAMNRPEEVMSIAQTIASVFSMGFPVVGLGIWQRSRDKHLEKLGQPPSIINNVTEAIKKLKSKE